MSTGTLNSGVCEAMKDSSVVSFIACEMEGGISRHLKEPLN